MSLNKDHIRKRTLILAIDRDDDVGNKGGIKTPIIGRDHVLNAAIKLLLNDPEEADGNAFFATVKLYDSYVLEDGEIKEVAIIAGSKAGGIESDKKLIKELEKVLEFFPANGIIIVSDGFEDEKVIPLISSKIPVISVQRVAVKHSERVEETYAILSKYLRMLWSEVPYKYYFIALPGLIFSLLGFLLMFKLIEHVIPLIMIVLGISMIVKGIGLDEYVSNLTKAPYPEFIRLLSYVASLISFIVGLYISYASISSLPEFVRIIEDPSLVWTHGAYIVAKFLPTLLVAVLITSLIYTVGQILYLVTVERYYKIARYLLYVEIVTLIYVSGLEASEIILNPLKGYLTLVIYVVVGLLVISLSIVVLYNIVRKLQKQE
ncbi:MAG: DUF373 family protein [Candidatus Geothermarchaeota archaeon]